MLPASIQRTTPGTAMSSRSLITLPFPLVLKASRWRERPAARPARSSSRRGAKAGRVTCMLHGCRGTRGRQPNVNLHELPCPDGWLSLHPSARCPASCARSLRAVRHCARQSCGLAPCNPPLMCSAEARTFFLRVQAQRLWPLHCSQCRLRPVCWRAGESQGVIPLDQRQRDDNLAWFLPPPPPPRLSKRRGLALPSCAVLEHRRCAGR